MFLKYVRLFFEFLVSRSHQIIARISPGVLCTHPLEVPSLFHRPHMRKRLRLRFWLRAGAGASKLLLLLVFMPLRLEFWVFLPYLKSLILNSAAIVVCLLHFTSLQFCTAWMLRSVQFNLAQSSVQVGLLVRFGWGFGFPFFGGSLRVVNFRRPRLAVAY